MRVLASAIVLSVPFGPAFETETTPQPLTRADCEKAGMQEGKVTVPHATS